MNYIISEELRQLVLMALGELKGNTAIGPKNVRLSSLDFAILNLKPVKEEDKAEESE